MEIGAAQVVIGVSVPMAMTVPMTMTVPMAVSVPMTMTMTVPMPMSRRAVTVRLGVVIRCVVPNIEYQHRHAVHDEADDRDDDRRVERNRNRCPEARHALDGHVDREPGQEQSARVAAERIDLAGTEREPGIAGMAAAVDVGKDRQSERDRVGGHVQAVGEQRHRTEREPGHDLDHHGRGGQKGDDQGAQLPRSPPIQTERVAVLPGREIRLVH